MSALLQAGAAAPVSPSLPPSKPEQPYPRLHEVERVALRLAGQIMPTPVWRWQTGVIARQFNPLTEVWLKLELFQQTGSFKLRGALNAVQSLSDEQRRRGVVAASAGNHAVAVACAARAVGSHAKLVMPKFASPVRLDACRGYGAELILTDTLAEAFALADRVMVDEGRSMVHPYDGPRTAEGTGTIGLELMRQVRGLDAVVVPVGGGGLAGGIASIVKQINPRCQVFGVEPHGADAMYRSFQAGRPVRLEGVDTIADSLSAPYAMAYSYGVCRRFVDEIVRVDDDALVSAMHHLFLDMKLAAEPAAAAATAALLGPLRERLDGRRVALIVCGSNIDAARYGELLRQAR
ncbi:threonine/serine dehydratase [Piscinibacter sp. HJYY11]|uniref:threonine ammonia-lyase n=1 Tax=Piscinibacter sp. HJYY11 TaxID=2801333 RepID=UPI0019200B69|nr:pyridoxal-phosphate dependent enzyme [Piscinibacter sp. HJYY11]MBL0729233.1 pyridoxal-phosphate dependent enzyme [Piscinibacter sp. HJYY11]